MLLDASQDRNNDFLATIWHKELSRNGWPHVFRWKKNWTCIKVHNADVWELARVFVVALFEAFFTPLSDSSRIVFTRKEAHEGKMGRETPHTRASLVNNQEDHKRRLGTSQLHCIICSDPPWETRNWKFEANLVPRVHLAFNMATSCLVKTRPRSSPHTGYGH